MFHIPPNPHQICNESINKPKAMAAAVECHLKTTFSEQIFNDYCLGNLSPYENFMMALKSKETRRQSPKLLKMFLDHIKLNISLTFEERVNSLYENSVTEKNWLATNTFRYILFHEKSDRKYTNAKIANGSQIITI